MNYYTATIASSDFTATVARVRELLAGEGFGVVTEINMRETMKRKLDVDFRNYLILGACNPPLAHRALTAEDKVGVLLPCNVVIQELDGSVEVAAMDPVGAMSIVGNAELEAVAAEVKARLDRVIAAIA